MQDIVLEFPDVSTMADFIIKNEICGVQINSQRLSIDGSLSEDLVREAVTNYNAIVDNLHLEAPVASAEICKNLIERHRSEPKKRFW